MPSSRKGHAVRVIRTMGQRHQTYAGWAYLATQQTKRKAMKIAKERAQAGWGVQVVLFENGALHTPKIIWSKNL